MVVNWSAQNRHWGPARHQELVGIANVILNVGSCEWNGLCFLLEHSMEVCAFYSKDSSLCFLLKAFNGSFGFLLEAFLRYAFPAALTSQCELLEIQADLTNFWMKLQNSETRSLNYTPRRERESTQSLRELTASCSICCWIKRTSETDTHFVTQLIHALSNVTPQEHFAIFSFQRA